MEGTNSIADTSESHEETPETPERPNHFGIWGVALWAKYAILYDNHVGIWR